MNRVLWLLPLLALTSACEKPTAKPEDLTGPNSLVWSNQAFSLRNGAGHGSLNLSGGYLSLHVRKLPPSTRLDLAGTSATTDATGAADLKSKLSPRYGDLRVDSLTRAKLSGVQLTITPANGSAFDAPLPALDVYDADDYLLGVVRAPVTFVGDGPLSGPPRNAIWLHGHPAKLVGRPATTLRELDGIAIEKRSDGTATRKCTGYKDDAGKPQPDVTVRLKSTTMDVYDRRTGKVVASKTFPPVDRCPTWLTGKAGKALVRDSQVQTGEILAWLRETVTGE